MALLYRAEIRPGKLELLADWLPTRPWYQGPAVPILSRVAAFRFDDPDGEVGLETLLVRADDGPLLQVPLTYRNAPLDGRDEWLVGTMEHSVLGQRWAYDGCGDPVYAAVLAHTILTGGSEAQEFLEVDGRLEPRQSTTSVTGSGGDVESPPVGALVRVDDGDPTVIVTDAVELTVARVLDDRDDPAAEQLTLAGTWEGQPTPRVLAHARRR
jgi:hypothetical protein